MSSCCFANCSRSLGSQFTVHSCHTILACFHGPRPSGVDRKHDVLPYILRTLRLCKEVERMIVWSYRMFFRTRVLPRLALPAPNAIGTATEFSFPSVTCTPTTITAYPPCRRKRHSQPLEDGDVSADHESRLIYSMDQPCWDILGRKRNRSLSCLVLPLCSCRAVEAPFGARSWQHRPRGAVQAPYRARLRRPHHSSLARLRRRPVVVPSTGLPQRS